MAAAAVELVGCAASHATHAAFLTCLGELLRDMRHCGDGSEAAVMFLLDLQEGARKSGSERFILETSPYSSSARGR